MADNKNEQNTSDTETSPPPPPVLPPEPQLQVSMESITNSLPDRRQILNEDEK